jgi:branched-chain amino acid transport system substrate-binding protein
METRTRRRGFIAGCAAALAAPRLLANAPKGEVLRLGQSAPLTGAGAVAGKQFRDAASRWFERAAPPGSPRVELVTLDDGGQVERTLTNAKLLTANHGTAGFFGFCGPGANREGMLAAGEEQVPFIAPMSGMEVLRQRDQRHVFLLRASHRDEIRQIIRHTSSIGIARVGLLFEYESAGWEIRDAFAEAAQGARLVASPSASVSRGSAEVDAALPALAGAGVQAVILAANPAASAALVRAARKAGFGGSFYTLSTVGGKALLDALGAQATGISVAQVVPFPWGGGSAISREYLGFCEAVRLEPDFAGMEGYLAARWLTESLKRARLREGNAAALASALSTVAGMDLSGFPLALNPETRSLSNFVELTVVGSGLKFRK